MADALAALEIELAGLGRLDLACPALPETSPSAAMFSAE